VTDAGNALFTPDRPVLVVEAATPAATAAVLRAGAVVAERTAVMRPGADDALMPAVDAALCEAGVHPRELAAAVCGAGPGGFTSLRIAGALAKGIAHATGCALVAVPSLALAAAARAASAEPGARAWLVALDALRGERYVAEVDTVRADDRVRVTGYRYLGVRPAAALAGEAAHREIVDANAHPPRASAAAAFAAAGFTLGAAGAGVPALVVGAVDVDAWEPDYGRQAEAQARWEQAHGRALATALRPPDA
jgi:tRNA threonylcarbamoyladenosine biosynthesis protein TsaB